MLNLLIRLAALMGSYFGWWEYFRRRWKINVYFLPAFTMAVHFSLLFLPGLLNFLEEMSLFLYFGGILLALDALRREKFQLLKPYCSIGYGVALLLVMIVALSVRGKIFTWFDSFTHWATVVKNMLLFDRFPTSAQSAIGFPTYPLGASALVYYICNVTTDTESMQMLAQGFLDVCMFLPVFAYVKKHPVACGALALSLGSYFLVYNTPIQELLVDTLLPLSAMAAITFIDHEYPRREEKYRIWFVFPLLFLTLNIKNASFFYLAAAILILIFRQKQIRGPRKDVLWLLLALGIGYFLWDRHSDYVFHNADMSQHAVSLAYLKWRLAEKSPALVLTIVRNVFLFAFTRTEFVQMLGYGILLSGLIWFAAPALRKGLAKFTAFVILVYLLYVASLAGMYVFSMSAFGAENLESIQRYMCSIDIAYLYLLLIGCFFLFDQMTHRLWVAALSLLFLTEILWSCAGIAFYDSDDSLERLEIENIIQEYGIAPGHSYLVLSDGDSTLYRHYVYRYCLNSPDVTSLVITDAAQLDEAGHHFFIIVEDADNPIIQAWIQEHYPNQAGQQVIRDF